MILFGRPRTTRSKMSRSRGVRRASRSAAVLRHSASFPESRMRSSARPMLARSSSGRTGFSRKSAAPVFIARIAIAMSPWPVIMIAGKPRFSAFNRSSRAIPPMPGIRASTTRHPFRSGRSAARNASPLACELGQQLELLPLRPQQLIEVLAEDPVELLMQLDDLDLGLQVDLVIQASGQTIARRLAVLGHQDDRRLQRGQHGKNKVEEDIGVGIEWFDLPCPDDAVESGPGDQRDETQSYERPGPAE